ncbi:hypothetical protein THITH_08345 [Thioalkalivibrio paradoxus ARh 1]|uniref:Uncharacterized protein n=2 Tax=Thioalkalivibrio paradoxus TaxID=108010 RepID=W0DT62_9GAMM|nr:hypothetical protein THITH_08345 [Thioalkalivibrio paradoxus ARh 1]
MASNAFEVVPPGLNLRSSTQVTPSNRIAVLPQGTRVTKLDDADDAGWWKVWVEIEGRPVEGFVAYRFLAPVAEPAPSSPLSAPDLPAAHLAEGRADVTRAFHGHWAFPLGESERPSPPEGDVSARVSAIVSIVEWLAVDRTEQHRRWWKNPSTTYCNVYAHDLCYLAGCYLPRVWWNVSAILRLARGETVRPIYGQTVTEVRANSLFDWLNEHGSNFGWQRSFSLDEVQENANGGRLGLIVAQRHDLNRSGHISVVVPEHGNHSAARHAGSVERPLQTQAGVTNRRWFNGPHAWWRGGQFREFGFWTHQG